MKTKLHGVRMLGPNLTPVRRQLSRVAYDWDCLEFYSKSRTIARFAGIGIDDLIFFFSRGLLLKKMKFSNKGLYNCYMNCITLQKFLVAQIREVKEVSLVLRATTCQTCLRETDSTKRIFSFAELKRTK